MEVFPLKQLLKVIVLPVILDLIIQLLSGITEEYGGQLSTVLCLRLTDGQSYLIEIQMQSLGHIFIYEELEQFFINN
ncbi:conserved hypothetical protein [Ricinus communis]|uniref:Uncharacterized protein n=1 Tax=Ricinus communis TaxID=3988 RepID=B9RVH7_RICCO|nr:conserved hypothetical protein [Ricinus communis]